MNQVGMKDARTAPRIRLTCHLFFSNEEHLEGEATVIDLSKTGCAAESETCVEAGMTFDLSIFLPDYDWRLHNDRAIVWWFGGQIFGLESQDLRPGSAECLSRLVEKFRAQ